MSDDKIHLAIDRAAKAQALLDNDLLREGFEQLEAAYISAWKISPARDAIGREKLWVAVNVVGKVREHLHRIISDGKLAQADLKMRFDKAA